MRPFSPVARRSPHDTRTPRSKGPAIPEAEEGSDEGNGTEADPSSEEDQGSEARRKAARKARAQVEGQGHQPAARRRQAGARSGHVAALYGPEKLDRALRYIAATPEDEKPGGTRIADPLKLLYS